MGKLRRGPGADGGVEATMAAGLRPGVPSPKSGGACRRSLAGSEFTAPQCGVSNPGRALVQPGA